jgi:predicted Ser/Thr protein kinase
MFEIPPSLGSNQRFEIVSPLGAGHLGYVYRALDRVLGTDVALKTLRELSPEQMYRIKTEFRAVSQLSHPNLVQLHELFVEHDACFFTMELVDGVDFVQTVQAAGDLAARLDRVLELAPRLADGLAALHASGRVHRDVKPSNVLVDARGRVVLLDFDLAAVRRTGASLGTAVGTFAYMAPEQVWGAAGPSADMFSVGAVIYEALTGKLLPPTTGRGSAAMAGVLARDIPEPVASVVAELLDAPGRRPSARQLRERLHAHAGPAVAAHLPELEFVGRADEARHLRRVMLLAEGARVAIVSGPSGIGKTALMRHVLAGAPSGTLCLEAVCHPRERVAFNGLDSIVDGLTDALCGMEAAERAALIGDDAHALAKLFPVLSRVPGVDAHLAAPADRVEQRRAGATGLRILMSRLATSRPMVLWIDDMQWIDDDSAALIGDLMRPPDPPVLCLVLCHRAESNAPLVHQMERFGCLHMELRVDALSLAPLPAGDARQLVAHALAQGHTVADSAQQIIEEANGSPFLLLTLAAYAARPAAHASEAHVSLDAVLDAELEALGDGSREILAAAALCGRPTERGALLRAAGSGEAARPLIAQLENRRLLRTRPVRGEIHVEMYHDRIRAALEAKLAGREASRRHLQYAESFERDGLEPAVLAHHLHLGGALERASCAAEDAGRRADRAFAFAGAAEHFARARAWAGEAACGADREHLLLEAEAEAWGKAGRLEASGELYLKAAARRAGVAQLSLRQRAVDQLLGGGSFDRAEPELRALLADLDLRCPRAPARAVASAMVHLVRGVLRSRSPRPASAIEALRIDVAYGAGRRLVDVDAARGAYLSALALSRARRVHDPFRLARSLCVGGGAVGALGGSLFQRLGAKLMREASSIAAELESDALHGMIDVALGEIHMLAGHWRESVAHFDAGVARLLAARGHTFECTTGRRLVLRSLEELGELDRVYRDARRLLDDATSERNLYGELGACEGLAHVLIARDDPKRAREQLGLGAERLTRRDLHMQHLYLARSHAFCDLYEGDADGAAARLDAVITKLRGTAMLQIPLIRVDVTSLGGRIAIARATATDGSRGTERSAPRSPMRSERSSDALRAARRAEAALRRERRVDAELRARLLRAGILSLDDPRAAAREIAGAERLAEQLGMKLTSACAARRRAEWGREDLADADAVLAGMGVAVPQRMSALMIPGRGAS